MLMLILLLVLQIGFRWNTSTVQTIIAVRHVGGRGGGNGRESTKAACTTPTPAPGAGQKMIVDPKLGERAEL